MVTRVSGSRVVVRNGTSAPSVNSAASNNIISAPTGIVIAESTLTVVTNKLQVSSTSSTDTVVIQFDATQNVSNPLNLPYSSGDQFGTKAQRISGGVYLPGGLGVEKDLNVGGYIYGRVSQATTSLQVLITATNLDQTFYPIFSPVSTGTALLFSDSTGENGGLTYNPLKGKLIVDRMHVASTDSSTSTITGAFTVSGGVGILGAVHIGDNVTIDGNVLPATSSTYSIGTTSSVWAEAFLDTIYTKLVTSSEGKVQINPQNKLTEIIGDIRVLGNNPVGTAPVVTNLLYVTVDGNDTNDGRAMDPSRACRTIGGAINSPYFQPGTQIVVSPGHYLENNPLRLKPYTSIRGSDIRTTFVEPMNKTQDLFHLDSGTYLNYMTFLNGRSGLLEGPYAEGFNRGAYATAFPPLEGNERIDLFHSPYVQNCTNLSGPWLKDGTLFTPNQTVQVPAVVGTGTWLANTTTIVVSASTGTITQGMYINAGQQNPGFFNARTLMLANKEFMQEQVVAYVDQTFNGGAFSYNTASCHRDVGLIIDSIATDLLYDSVSESTFAGIQYWNQSATTNSIIPGELAQTIAAFNYLKTQAMAVVTSNAVTVGADFDVFLGILSSGTAGVTDIIVSNGLPSTTSSVVNDYNTLIAAIPTLTTQTISFINTTFPGFTFDTEKCRRDIGYVIKSVAFDLLHGGNKQAIKSGVYYYGYTNNTAIPGEIQQTLAAYSFISSIVGKIVRSEPVSKTYQSPLSIPQIFGSAASETEALELATKLSLITGIIANGPGDDVVKEPMDLNPTTKLRAREAFNLLMANKTFIQAEVIAFIDSQFNSFTYSREKCFRDVGILVENISYDAAYGGNQKAVESGLAYYSGVVSYIAGQEIQTTSAINYLNSLIQKVITNRTCDDLLSGSGEYSQIINFVLTGGEVSSPSINYLTGIITSIINNGPDAAPPVYTSPGPDSAFVSAETLLEANRKFIQEDTINWINNTFLNFPYSEIKCRRDTGLIIDSIALDLKYPTPYHSQSTFAGLQYWNQKSLTPTIIDEITTTTQAVTYLKEIAGKVIQNVTPSLDLIPRYSSSTQITTLEPATTEELVILNDRFDEIIEILEGNQLGWTDRITPNGNVSALLGVRNAYNLLQANKDYMKDEITAYIDYVSTSTGFVYNTSTCRRDIGYMIDAVSFDILHGGNRQSVQNGLYYYGFSNSSAIHNQNTQTVAAFTYLSSLTTAIVQNIAVTPRQQAVPQIFTTSTATVSEATALGISLNTITNIISLGTGTAAVNQGIVFTSTVSTSVVAAYNNLYANKQFLIEEVIAYIDQTYNPLSFNYDEAKCYRDIGLIVDAVSQDIILGGNQKSVEAGLAYWSAGYNAVTGQVTTTTMAINHAAMLSTATIANKLIIPQTGTITKQVINPFFDYGYEYGPQEAVKRNFKIITDIIEKGPLYAPPVYAGGGLFALTGLNGADVKIAPRVTSVSTLTTGTYLVGLNTATIGFGNNSTLYFGDTYVFPLQDKEVQELSAGYPWYNTSTWNQRMVDPIGAMGGSLVDGAVISNRSPIQSFVYDAFTQLTQGGRGVHVKNDGYAQLVSVFTIFCSTGVITESGGIASIVNSNANFGDICLLSKGFGKRKFTGHVYNPEFKAYPESPNLPGGEFLDQYYPNGFWPNAARMRVFLPDLDNRPHISLIMEVEPPEGYTNAQELPGFLNAAPSKASLTTGTIVITDIDTEGIAVGNSIYIRDQENNFTYADTGTIVTDIGYRSITLNKALIGGGEDPTNTETIKNDNWFDLYFCGNAYYTVLSSEVSDLPKYNRQNQLIPDNVNVLSTAATGWADDQIEPHAQTLRYLNTLTTAVINNINLGDPRQFRDLLVTGGGQSQAFIDQRFGEITSILTATNLTVAESIIPERLRFKTGTVPLGAGSAITLIQKNIEFLADKVSEYTSSTFFPSWGTLSIESKQYILKKCQRDAKIILQRVIYDLQTGGRYNSVMAGLSYWRRKGSYHVVTLGETVRNPALFPDGATVNFYQRSYMSASGYVFEYVGAGTNYGALPQVGRADPVQGKETVQVNNGKVFFTSTDQNGDFRIGPSLVISQATGVLSGRTFTKSLFANMTPFILAIEGGGL
jgi:hypothetical protein